MRSTWNVWKIGTYWPRTLVTTGTISDVAGGWGAEHTIVTGFHLGNSVDSEPNGQPSLEANADDLAGSPDDEDAVTSVNGGGVTITGGLKRGDSAAQLKVFVTNTAGVSNPYLDAWMDFNQDGDWDDAGERIASQSVVAGSNTTSFAVPSGQLGSTFARFRLHSATGPGLHPGGVASKGEVEDHRVVITFDVNDPAEVAKLMASDAARDAYFGHSVAVSRDTAVIGAVGDRELGDYSGAAYVFTLNDGHWSQQLSFWQATR